MAFRFLLPTLALSVLATAALAAETADGPKDCPVKAGAGSYSYDPTTDTGPAHWGDLPGFSTCKTGLIQSPVDFPTDVKYADLEDGPHPNITVATMSFSAGSYNWALNCETAGTCGYTMFADKKFHVVNIHMHAPSEHYLGGKQYPLEAHIVHASDDGQLAVIATMFDYPDDMSYPGMVYAGKPKEYGANILINQMLKGVLNDKGTFPVALGIIMAPRKGYCSYGGSLTTPPCSEGVTFFMSMQVQHVSKQQVHTYGVTAGASYYGNARPLNPLNGREILCYL